MTDWTPENNRIQTMHLTEDELAALKAAKWGWVASHEFRPDDWRDVEAPNWTSVRIYRAKPAPVTQDVVPWGAIVKEVVYTQRQFEGPCYGYDAENRLYCRISGVFAGYTPGTCDWRDSLQQRPVTVGAVTEPLEIGQVYWVVCLNVPEYCTRNVWHGLTEITEIWLSRGLIHLTQSDAVAAAKTMCAKGGV